MIALLSIAAYLAVAVMVYIRMVPVCYRRKIADKEFMFDDTNERYARESAPLMAGWRAVLWPYAVIYESVVRKVNAAAWRPIVDAQKRHARLVEDRDTWQARARDHSTSPEQRRMASDIVTTLDDILRREAR